MILFLNVGLLESYDFLNTVPSQFFCVSEKIDEGNDMLVVEKKVISSLRRNSCKLIFISINYCL